MLKTKRIINNPQILRLKMQKMDRKCKNQEELILTKVYLYYLNLDLFLVCKKIDESSNEQKTNMYELVGIISDDLFEKGETHKSFVFYFDGQNWIQDGQKYPF